jgi:hypothetical protein
MRMVSTSLALLLAASVSSSLLAADDKPMSPRGTAAAQVAGKWVGEGDARKKYEGGKWLEIDYGRPLLRGRPEVFGKGADYGKAVNAGAPVWRAGANQTTRLHTEATLELGGKKLAPGDYDLFIDLKADAWTLIVSRQPVKETYKDEDKSKVWGAYGYDPKLDVLRVPMKVTTGTASVDQLTWGFEDVGDKAGKLALSWDKTHATAAFTVAD